MQDSLIFALVSIPIIEMRKCKLIILSLKPITTLLNMKCREVIKQKLKLFGGPCINKGKLK